MVKAMQRRLIKRGLELIGAVAVVYLMLELLDSHTSDQADMAGQNIKVQLPRSDSGGHEINELREQLRKVQQVQQEQQKKQPPPVPFVQQQPKPAANNPKPAPPKPNPQAPKPIAPKNPAPKAPVQKVAPKNVPVAADGSKANSGGSAKQTSLDLGVNLDFAKLNLPYPSLKSKGFVLPMLYFDMGPNNLFRLFRQATVTAYEMGRGVVVPVFHRHPRMGDAAENPFVLPIFDTNYTVDLVWPPSATIDAGMLKKVINTVSMKEFNRNCKGKLDVVVRCGDVDVKREDGLKHFQRAADMKIAKEITIQSYEELVPNDLSAGIIGPDEDKCMGIVYGKKCLPDQDRWLATFSRIADNFWRPQPIRNFALKFIAQKLGGKPFMAFHWRYESDWLDMCKPSRPKGARDRNREICRITMGLSYDDNVRSSFVETIKDKMADYNLKQIYLASPPNNIDLIRLLNESFPGNFFYMDDVMKFAEKTESPEFLSNNYKASFVEQEICFRSTLYLGAALSSWTQTVLTDRLSRGIVKHDSVLDVVGKGNPGFPKLVFQFPEGNFNFGGMMKDKKV
ncbi:uncharacterized protein LOC143469061 [Clavelina lepadiformis]|uniref:uncharacterized protein LOC143469061 n=1 Tax=Clavelina lepadiformis TaxID=159417 RepID=UPI0040418A6C